MKNKLLPLLVVPFMLTSCMTSFNYRFNNDISYGEYKERNLLDIAFPKKKKETSLIVYIHGGAWVSGSKDKFIKHFIIQYKDEYAYAAINYRYASEERVFFLFFLIVRPKTNQLIVIQSFYLGHQC